jgi:hypothetical protein
LGFSGDFLSGFIQFMTDLKVFWDCFLEMYDGFWRFSQWIYHQKMTGEIYCCFWRCLFEGFEAVGSQISGMPRKHFHGETLDFAYWDIKLRTVLKWACRQMSMTSCPTMWSSDPL